MNVGTIQIPHHGSYHSRGWKILKEVEIYTGDKVVSIITFGENNPYGHPSARVISELSNNGSLVVMVTETSTTLFIEILH